MATQKKMLVIGVTGMPGTGKTQFVRVAEERGFSVYRMGDAVWAWVKKKNLALTNDNVGKIADCERIKYGRGIWAKRTLDMIKKDSNKKTGKIIIDGLRSPEELDIFKNAFKARFILVAIQAGSEIRFRRLCGRKRIDDIRSRKDFEARDQRELSWGIAEVIKKADFVIINEDRLGIFRRNISDLLSRLETD